MIQHLYDVFGPKVKNEHKLHEMLHCALIIALPLSRLLNRDTVNWNLFLNYWHLLPIVMAFSLSNLFRTSIYVQLKKKKNCLPALNISELKMTVDDFAVG